MTVLLALLGVYLLVINLDGLILMGVDKSLARRGKRRIPEATLFLVAAIGGSARCCLSVFRLSGKRREKPPCGFSQHHGQHGQGIGHVLHPAAAGD